MRKFISFIFVLLFCTNAFATDFSIQKIEFTPLTGGVSFNTVTTSSVIGWVTASSVIGRKEVLILNNSTTDNIYLTGVSGSTATGTVFPRETATFKAGSGLRIYVSANTATPTSFEVWEIR